MASFDPIPLIIAIVLAILFIIGNLYFLAYYSHANDNDFGNSYFTKTILVSL